MHETACTGTHAAVKKRLAMHGYHHEILHTARVREELSVAERQACAKRLCAWVYQKQYQMIQSDETQGVYDVGE